MVSLNNLIPTIGDRLRGLSGNARLLVGAMLVILAMGLGFVALLAGRQDMVPLGLGPGLPAETRTRAVNFLDARGVAWDERNGSLFVPVEQKYAVLAQLTENDLITADQIDFSAIMEDDSPFTDRSTRRTRLLVIKMAEVSRMISELSGIEWAKVVIDQPDRSGGLGMARIESTASVTVQPRGDHLTQAQADAIARLVAGVHAELKPVNVTVVDARNSRAMLIHDDDDLSATKYLDMKLATEKLVKITIERALSVFPGVVVAVNAQVDATDEVQNRSTYTDPKTGVREESTRERTTTSERSSGEPGVRPNVGANLIGGGADRTTVMSDIEGATKIDNAFGNTVSRRRDPKGYPLKINAAILVPQSYVMSLWRQQQGDEAATPDLTELDPLVQTVKDEIRRLVEPLIDTGAIANAIPGKVVVSIFADVIAVGLVPGAAAGGGGGFGEGFVSEGLIGTVSLAGLALVSLTLMFMMVRRATPPEEMPSAEELAGMPPALSNTDAELVGEAEETVAAMEGLEIGEHAVRRQQMITQINELTAAAPDEAAALLRKWIKIDL